MKHRSNRRALLLAAGCLAGAASIAAQGCDKQRSDSENLGTITQALAAGAPSTYFLTAMLDGATMEVKGASGANGADIQTNDDATGADHQVWKFIEKADGTYRVRNLNSDKCMRAFESSNVQQGSCNGNRAKWHVEEPSGTVQLRLKNKATSLCATAHWGTGGERSVTQDTCAAGAGSDGTEMFHVLQWCGCGASCPNAC